METKFKVGDKVKIRKDLEDGEYYGDYYFNDDMAKMRGKYVTISRVIDDKVFLHKRLSVDVDACNV